MSAQTVRPTSTPIIPETTEPEVSAPPAESADTTAAAAPEEEVSTETPVAAESSSTSGLRPRIHLEGGYSWFDLSNNSGLDHGGPHLRLEGGLEVPFGDMFLAQANVTGTFAWGEHDLGLGSTSAFNAQTVGVNGRLGLSLFDDNFRITAGVEIGATHVGADFCEDGLACGLLFDRNAQLYPVDSWGVTLGGELGLSVLHGAIGLAVRGGVHSGLNPTVDLATQPDSPAFGLNIPWVQISLNTDVMGIVRLITGEGSNTASTEEEETAEAVEDGQTETAVDSEEGSDAATESTDAQSSEAATETPAPTPSVQGLELISQHLETIRGERGYAAEVRRHAEASQSTYSQFTAVRGSAADDRTRVLALDVISEVRQTVRAYGEIQELITQASRERLGLRGSDLSAAQRTINQMRQERNRLQRIVRRAFSRAQSVVRQFNRSTSGERIGLDFNNPIVRRESSSSDTSARPTPRPTPQPTEGETGRGSDTPTPPPPATSLPPTPEGE